MTFSVTLFPMVTCPSWQVKENGTSQTNHKTRVQGEAAEERTNVGCHKTHQCYRLAVHSQEDLGGRESEYRYFCASFFRMTRALCTGAASVVMEHERSSQDEVVSQLSF